MVQHGVPIAVTNPSGSKVSDAVFGTIFLGEGNAQAQNSF